MARAGRPRKPSALRALEGMRGHSRPLATVEPKLPAADPAELLPPAELDARAVEEWNRLLPSVVRSGLLTAADRATFAAYCVAWSDWVRAVKSSRKAKLLQETSGGVAVGGMFRALESAEKRLLRAAAELGLTPAARSRVQAVKVGEDDADEAALAAALR